ncbi:hypothetical protein FHX48_000279 [Microbacterium halimionae]|uniref:Uncharacterized protein n=1 Tax=Microbacterium halimionae TaxID=1526413 RepID=A0A7W3JLV5_9MICO|nr:hypothetical protein [Microbacterium halimionae]MBA8815227.1 hypothetical protein [Microbacterium halimionae]NII93982.1 hypothetical protein [Microbacterium halimionae]
MLYLLEGGPRAKQLVDDLPVNYHVNAPNETPECVEVLEGLVADVAHWRPASDRP